MIANGCHTPSDGPRDKERLSKLLFCPEVLKILIHEEIGTRRRTRCSALDPNRVASLNPA